MPAIFAWLKSAPDGTPALITGILAALVAVLVTALTQWILGRRNRTTLLVEKLEALYLILNEHWTYIKAGRQIASLLKAPLLDRALSIESDFRSWREEGELLFIRRNMYVGLYFSKMKLTHDELGQSGVILFELISQAIRKKTILEEEIYQEKSWAYSLLLSKMQRELVANKSSLIVEYWFSQRHKREA